MTSTLLPYIPLQCFLIMLHESVILVGESFFFVTLRLVKYILVPPRPGSTSFLETEKAEADCCQANTPFLSLFSLINFAELSSTTVANVSSDNLEERETRK